MPDTFSNVSYILRINCKQSLSYYSRNTLTAETYQYTAVFDEVESSGILGIL